jgi:hypothetical protein
MAEPSYDLDDYVEKIVEVRAILGLVTHPQ